MRQHHSRNSRQVSIRVDQIDLKDVQPQLFNRIAREAAAHIAESGGSKKNKSTQLRRFFDEVVMWDTRTAENPDDFNNMLPFILMINAKVAYAEGRELIDANFTTLMETCLDQVESQQSMRNFKLFLEAFMGFFKFERECRDYRD